MLNTYSETLIGDLATQQKVIAAITSSFYFVDIQKCDKDNGRLQRIFHFNPTSHTLIDIGTVHERLPYHRELYRGKCITDFGMFCSDGRRCALINLVNLKVTHLPSLPESAKVVTAVAMGSKVFLYVMVPFKTRKKHFDHWDDCALPELYATSSTRITSIDTSIFLILSPELILDCLFSPSSGKDVYVVKLLCYDLKKKHKSDIAESPASVKQSPCAIALSPESARSNFLCYDTVNKSFSYRSETPHDISSLPEFPRVVAVVKDIYFLTSFHMFCYSTTEDSWKKITNRRHRPTRHAFCLKGKLAVLGLGRSSTGEFDLEVYDNKTDTWELSSVNMGQKFEWGLYYNVFSSY